MDHETSRHDGGPVSRRTRAWLLVGLTLWAFALMSWRLDAKSLWWDESLSLQRAQGSLPAILAGHIDFAGVQTVDQHPPLYFALLKIAIALGGENDLAVRLPSVVFGTLLTPLLYALGRRLRNATAGLLAAALGANSPFFLWYAQEARMYTMVTALSLLATYALWVTLCDRRWLWGAICALALAAALMTHYLTLLLWPFYLGVALALWPGRQREATWRSWPRRAALRWAGALSALALTLALVIVLGRLPRLVPPPGAYEVFVPLDRMLLDALNSFSLGLSVTLSVHWPLLIPFGAVYAAGIGALVVRGGTAARQGLAWAGGNAALQPSRPRFAWARAFLLIGYWAMPVAAIWLLSHWVPFYVNSRYLMASSPAFYLTVALGLEMFWARRRAIGLLLLLLLLALMGYSTHRYFFDPYYHSKEDYRSAARLIQERECVDDAIVITGPESLVAFAHYYRGDAPVFALPVGNTPWRETEQQLQALMGSYRRIWHLQARNAFTDPSNYTARWFDRQATAVDRIILPSSGFHMRLSCYLTARPDFEPAPAETLARTAGLRLSGVTLRYRGADGLAHAHVVDRGMWPEVGADEHMVGPLRGGQSLALDLTWAVEDALPDLKMSLRLVHDGGTWAQADQRPSELLPTFVWPVGRGMAHTLVLPIPADTPPSDYWVQMWVYDAESGAPRSFVDAASGLETPYVMLARVAIETPAAGDSVPRPQLPPGVVRPPGGASFGQRLDLLGWRLGNGDDLRADESAILHLFWRVHRPLDDGWALVINWVDEAGHVWRSETRPLAGNDSPPSRWAVGSQIHGVVTLSVPADATPGAHKISILVRDSAGRLLLLRRGPWPWAGRNLVVGQITIAR